MILDFAHVLAAVNSVGYALTSVYYLYYLARYRHVLNGSAVIIVLIVILCVATSTAYIIVFLDLFPDNDPPINVLLLRLVMFSMIFVFVLMLNRLITKNEVSNNRECQDRVAVLESELADKLTAIDLKDKTIKLLHDMLDREKQHPTSH